MTSDSLSAECSYQIYLTMPPAVRIRLADLQKQILDQVLTMPVAQINHNAGDLLLARFDSLLLREELLVKAIAQVCRQTDGFLLRFAGVENQPSHSFLLLPASREELLALSRNLKKIRSAIRSETVTPFFIQEFTWAIFRNLTAFQFDAIEPVIGHTHINIQCLATELKLLKRRKLAGAKWEVLKTFFLKKEAALVQSQLF